MTKYIVTNSDITTLVEARQALLDYQTILKSLYTSTIFNRRELEPKLEKLFLNNDRLKKLTLDLQGD